MLELQRQELQLVLVLAELLLICLLDVLDVVFVLLLEGLHQHELGEFALGDLVFTLFLNLFEGELEVLLHVLQILNRASMYSLRLLFLLDCHVQPILQRLQLGA